jgi:hypothetical protein
VIKDAQTAIDSSKGIIGLLTIDSSLGAPNSSIVSVSFTGVWSAVGHEMMDEILMSYREAAFLTLVSQRQPPLVSKRE